MYRSPQIVRTCLNHRAGRFQPAALIVLIAAPSLVIVVLFFVSVIALTFVPTSASALALTGPAIAAAGLQNHVEIHLSCKIE